MCCGSRHQTCSQQMRKRLNSSSLTQKRDTPASIRVGNVIIKEVSSIKLLGLYIDNNLQWKTHLQYLQKILTSRIGLIRRLRRFLSDEQMTQIAHGCVISIIRYALAVYGRPRLHQEAPRHQQHEAIQVELNNIMRCICRSQRADHISVAKLCPQSKLPTLNQMVVEAMLIEVWKCVHYDLPCLELFEPTPHHHPTLRQRNDVFWCPIPAPSRPEWLLYKGTILWNQLPADVRMETSFASAEKQIKTFAKDYAII